MTNEGTRLTREELYERVWSKPATKEAKELGIQMLRLAEICNKLNRRTGSATECVVYSM